MKKIVFVIIILAAVAVSSANAQLGGNLSLGPLVGFGYSWIHFSPTGDASQTKFKPSYNGGARLVYSATPHIGVALDGTFRKEGTKIKTGQYRATTHLNYINLDPKLYYFFCRYGQAFRPKIGIGPTFGFLVSGTINEYNGFNNTEIQSKEVYGNFNFGLSGTLGFNQRIGSGTALNVDAVYNNGLSNILKNGSNYEKYTTRSFFLNVGITFGIGQVGSGK